MKSTEFVGLANENQSLSYKHGWVPAKPLPQPFIWRLKDAWAVLLGRAEAVCFPGCDDAIDCDVKNRNEAIK